MSIQRAPLVDHDELADLQDEPSYYTDALERGNQDGQPPTTVLQIQDSDAAIDTREQSVPPTPEHNPAQIRFPNNNKDSAPNSRLGTTTASTTAASPVLFINHGQTQLDVANAPVSVPRPNPGSPRVVVTQPDGLTTHSSPTLVQPPPPPNGDLVRVLKEKDILFIQIFASIVCICFPFTGVLAILHSYKTKKLFNDGKLDLAQKRAQKAEHYILCTIILGFVFLIVLIVIIESSVNKDYRGDWNHPGRNFTSNDGLIMG